MKRLRPGRDVELTQVGGATLNCRVIAVAGVWTLLAVRDKSEPLPDWLGGEVYLVFFEAVYPVRLRGRVELGREPGELRFTTVSSLGHEPEPRSAPRVPVSLLASIMLADGHMIDGEVLDISAGGMKLKFDTNLGAGVEARIRLQLPDGPLIDADFVVNHLRPGTSSVRFLNFRTGTSEEIAAWCVNQLRGA